MSAVPAVEPPAEMRLLTPEQAAQILGCGRSYMFHMIASGEVRSIKVGRLRRIPIAEVERYIARRLSADSD